MGNCLQRLSLAALTMTSFWISMGCTSTPTHHDESRSPASAVKNNSVHLSWPLTVHNLSRGFNPHSDEPHDGLDLRARKGTPILAADDGRVVYSGHAFHGYGKMVLIEHQSKVATLYGHCSQIFVRTGDKVSRGHKIALVGKTGRATAPHLHFEVRQNKHPVDPLDYLQ